MIDRKLYSFHKIFIEKQSGLSGTVVSYYLSCKGRRQLDFREIQTFGCSIRFADERHSFELNTVSVPLSSSSADH